MSIIEIFRTACQNDCGTVPQWLMFFTSCLTFIAVVFGFYFTRKQLQHARSVRETENILSILESLLGHNAKFKKDDPALKAIQEIEGLNVPASERDAEMYWATRHVHVSHINLIWRAWELAGRPRRGEPINARYDGWERFAREVVMKNLRESARKVKNDEGSPADVAASDVWHGLNTYEVLPTKFVQWLDGLDVS
jgi:hypothetical protein